MTRGRSGTFALAALCTLGAPAIAIEVSGVRSQDTQANAGRKGRFGLAALCAAFGALIAFPAAAEEITNAKAIDLQVQGRIPEHCILGSPGQFDFGDITRPNLSVETRVVFDCNMPFTVNVRAQNGALAHSALPLGQGPYAGALDYRLDLELAVRKPATEMISHAYASPSLRAGQNFSSNGGIAADGLSLRMTLAPPSRDAGLLAGNYGEVIVITVTPS